MKNLNIRAKMVILYVIMSLFTIVMLGVLIWGEIRLSKGQDDIHDIAMSSTRTTSEFMSQLQGDIITTNDAYYSMGSSGGEAFEATQTLEKSIETGNDLISQIKEETKDEPSLKTLSDSLGKDYQDEYVPIINGLIEASNSGDDSAAMEYLNSSTEKINELNEKSINLIEQADKWAISITNAGRKTVSLVLYITPAILVLYVLVVIYIGRKLALQVAVPADVLQEAAKQIAQGNINIEIEHESNDEMGRLASVFRNMINAIAAQEQVLATVAQGDLTAHIEKRSDRDTMNEAIASLIKNNNELVTQIIQASDQVLVGAEQISQGSQNLATGSTEQAASIQELTASINEILRQANDNTDKADQAYQNMLKSSELMSGGVQSMRDMTDAMREINDSSNDIANVIKVIDDIAFQTNILALNAAVEAARAGQHGRGFAVVAEEVRDLASKSAEAAQQTAELIENSIQRVNEGTAIANATSKNIEEVNEFTEQDAILMQEINELSQIQASSIQEVTSGVEQVSSVVQANSATSEEAAASAEEMSAQAQALREIVSRFKV